jgi:lysophospholipid acyltransferase (LPLAT)-like uncharacterized protein
MTTVGTVARSDNAIAINNQYAAVSSFVSFLAKLWHSRLHLMLFYYFGKFL